MAAEDLKFVHEDSETIISELKSALEDSLGRTIAPADIEMLLINAFAYRELLLRTGLNEAARQNMVSFSRGAALEYLGQLVGVTRQPAAGALCTLKFTLVAGHNGVTIPEGLRVQSLDGKIIFQTTEDKVCPVGTLEATVSANASTPGTVGNGYAVNTIAIILDPLAFVATAQNIDITGGGADEETDDRLRERIMLAPASFSVAGPDDAYRFFAKSAHPSIVDVAITSPMPDPEEVLLGALTDAGLTQSQIDDFIAGNFYAPVLVAMQQYAKSEVDIFPLLEGGNMPTQEILDAVQAICNSKKIRPLTDTVITAQPTKVDYAIVVDLTLLTTAVSAATQANVQQVLEDYKEQRKNRLGLDVVLSKIKALSMIDGVYDCNVTSPAANIVADPEVYTNCTSVTVNVIATHDE